MRCDTPSQIPPPAPQGENSDFSLGWRTWEPMILASLFKLCSCIYCLYGFCSSIRLTSLLFFLPKYCFAHENDFKLSIFFCATRSFFSCPLIVPKKMPEERRSALSNLSLHGVPGIAWSHLGGGGVAVGELTTREHLWLLPGQGRKPPALLGPWVNYQRILLG